MADKITEIIDPIAFKQVEDLRADLTELSGIMNNLIVTSMKLNTSLSDKKGISEISKAIKNQNEELSTLSATQSKIITKNTELISAEVQLSESLKSTANSINEKQKAELNALLSAKEWAKANKLVVEENKKVGVSIDDLRKKRLGEKLAVQDMMKAEKELAQVEISVANSMERARKENILLRAERDKLNLNTIGGIKRAMELNTQIDANTKFLKSNGDQAQKQSLNVGNYASALDNVFKQGSKAFGVLRTIANILPGMGMSGVIMVAIEGVGLLAEKMGFLSSKTQEEIENSKAFSEAHKQMVATISNELTSLEVLYQTATNVNLSYKQRGEAVDELQKQYPEMFNNANREKLLNGELTDSYTMLSSAIYKRAEETAKMNMINKLIAERTDAQLRLDKLTKAGNESEFYYDRASIESIKNTIKLKDDQIKQIETSIQKSKEGFGKDIFYIDQKTKKEVESQEKINKHNAIYGKSSSKTSNKTTNINKGAKEERQKEIKEYENDLNRLDREVQLMNEETDLKTIERVKKRAEEIKRINEKYAQDEINLIVENLRAQDEMWAKADEERLKRLDNYAMLIDASLNLLTSIEEIATQSIQNTTQKQIEAVDLSEKNQLESLDRLTLSDKERAERKKQIEIESEARRKAIHKESVSDLRKFAVFQKAIDTAEIISKTALAIMQYQVKPGFPAGIPLAIQAGVMGASQLAKVLATPLPQYAKGIESTPNDSYAIVGEKGTELVTEKSGKQWLTPSTDTLTYLPKGTKVTPHDELMKMVYDSAFIKLASNESATTTDSLQRALLESFNELTNDVKDLKKIMKGNNSNVTIEGNFDHYMRVKKAIGNV